MNDTKKLIEELDEIITEMKSRDKGGEDFIISKEDIVTLTEVKGIVEYYEKFEGKIKEIMASKAPQPLGDDLIEKIIETVNDISIRDVYPEIRKLLQATP